MMLHKSLVSFIAAFTVATGVVASTTPVARDGQCNTGTQSCCNSITYSTDPIVAVLKNLVNIAIPVDASIPLGISCVNILSASSW